MRAVIGHDHTWDVLVRAVEAGQVSHAYLLTGPDGIGKTALALDFARLLTCEQVVEGAPCGECASCRKIAHGNHPDVTLVEVDEGKRQLGVDAVRESVVRAANLAPSAGTWRVFILPAVERMTSNTVNALLKTVEEPPDDVVLLLTSADPDSLLPTLLSRCQILPMQPLPPVEVERALIDRWQVASAAARELAALAGGCLGWAVRAHEQPQLRAERAERLGQILALVDATRDQRIRTAGVLAGDGDAARRTVELWLLWWRDVTLAASGSAHLVTQGQARREAERIGRALGLMRAYAFLRALLNAQVALDQNANPRLTLEVLMLDLPTLAPAHGSR
ncbi:MAG TPA: DNA polymerase III subunit delta' [Ktedonobacterales bacterium]|nr:DNA polymerase III subunit delta' [Ktedonobacterales bacterium]